MEEKEFALDPTVETENVTDNVAQEPTAVMEAPAQVAPPTEAKAEIKDVKPIKVTIRPCKRVNFLPEGHDGEYRYSGTAEFLTAQRKRGTKQLLTGLTKKDETRLELAMGLPGKSAIMPAGTLSPYSEFWHSFKIKIPREGKVLDLSIPEDELEWHVLRVHQEVANSEEDRRTNAYARYVLTSEEEIAEVVNRIVEIKTEAYVAYGQMNDVSKRGFLKVYSRLYPTTQAVSDDAVSSTVQAAVGTIIDENPQAFLDVIRNVDYKKMLFLEELLAANLVKKERTRYLLQNGDLLGTTLDTTIDFLKDDNNQDVVLILKSQLAAND